MVMRLQVNLLSKILLSAFFAVLTVQASMLENRIKKIEKLNNPTEEDRLHLALLYIYADRYTESVKILLHGLEFKKNDAFLLFYASLAESIVNRVQADILWRRYFELPEKEADGKLWRDIGNLVYNSLQSGKCEYRDYRALAEKLFYGKAYYTLKCIIDFYIITSKDNSSFKELLGLVFYYNDFYENSLAVIEPLWKEKDDPFYRILIGKIYFKQQKYSQSVELLLPLLNSGYEAFNVRYLISYAFHQQGDNSSAKKYLNDAAVLIKNSREKSLHERLSLKISNNY
ncbi:MAG: hypothetical protein A2096_12820 [Spirochaetes bacterium GWF1_41_5]|nr:MAG: hypothetical protein A2096_12820 [Spirochaetes bacterium GWF1_41_5]HBE04055.1 hypothetical protein [Spirochaetia bacterium]